jgi:anthranilate 1,2-dioxygenase small subunit
MISFDVWAAVSTVLAKAANAVDSGDLESWLDCFAEDSTYHILSRENFEKKLPLTLFQCDNKNMMRDRVVSLREANVVNIHRDQHILGLPQLTDAEGGEWISKAGYAVYQSDVMGKSWLFAVGTYLDRLRFDGSSAVIRERRVLVDTFAIQNMLSTPI